MARVFRSTKEVQVTDEDLSLQYLKTISESEAEMAKIQERLEESKNSLFELLKKNSWEQFISPYGTAVLYRPQGRSSTEIDPRKFMQEVEEDVFFSCIKVLVTDAKKVLNKMQQNKLFKITEGVLGELTLRIEKPKK